MRTTWHENEERPNAKQEHQEREAVRGIEEEGHVEIARGADRELARLVQPRWQEIGQEELIAPS
jgi:hypothetical protein